MKKIILTILTALVCLSVYSQTKIDYHDGTYYIKCNIERDLNKQFLDEYYQMGESTIKLNIDSKIMEFEPHEEFKEKDLEFGEGFLHSFTFNHKNDTVFQVKNDGIAFVQSDYFVRAVTIRILITDSQYYNEDGVIGLDRWMMFGDNMERAIIIIKEADFIPKGSNKRIKLSSSVVKNNILKFMKNEKAFGYITDSSANHSNVSKPNSTPKSQDDSQSYFANSYIKGICSLENIVYKYDGNDNKQGYSTEKVMIWGSKDGFGLICRNLGVNLFFSASSGNCYLTKYKNGIREYTWTHGRQMSSGYKEDGDHHFALTTTNEDCILNIIKTRNGKIVRTYRILLEHETPITFTPDNSSSGTRTYGIALENKLIEQFGYHRHKSGVIHNGEPEF